MRLFKIPYSVSWNLTLIYFLVSDIYCIVYFHIVYNEWVFMQLNQCLVNLYYDIVTQEFCIHLLCLVFNIMEQRLTDFQISTFDQIFVIITQYRKLGFVDLQVNILFENWGIFGNKVEFCRHLHNLHILYLFFNNVVKRQFLPLHLLWSLDWQVTCRCINTIIPAFSKQYRFFMQLCIEFPHINSVSIIQLALLSEMPLKEAQMNKYNESKCLLTMNGKCLKKHSHSNVNATWLQVFCSWPLSTFTSGAEG